MFQCSRDRVWCWREVHQPWPGARVCWLLRWQPHSGPGGSDLLPVPAARAGQGQQTLLTPALTRAEPEQSLSCSNLDTIIIFSNLYSLQTFWKEKLRQRCSLHFACVNLNMSRVSRIIVQVVGRSIWLVACSAVVLFIWEMLTKPYAPPHPHLIGSYHIWPSS